MNSRLLHDCAFVMARHLMELLGSCLREEERQDAFSEFYQVCKAGLEAYEAQQDRLRRRMRPLDN